MSIIKFLDSTSNKRKSLIFPAGEDDIIINLPKDSGILATDRLTEKKIRENDSGYDRNVIFILKPDIKENNGGMTATNWDGYFKIASYRVSNGYLGKHTGTEWVAYSDERFTTLVDKSSDDLNKEMWKPNTNLPNLKLYVRYRFVSNSIYSPWSDSIITTTSSGGISPFDVSVEENTLTPGCLISGFKTYGDAVGATHTATTWVVYESTNGALENKVFDSGKDSVNKTGFTIPNGVLKGDMEYSLQVTLHTDNVKYANSIPYIRKFTTVGAYIHRPILQYKPTKDNQHKIIASEYISTARNETLVSAVWSLYDADDNRLINTVTNTSSEYDITPYISNNKKYYVTLIYKSNTLTSKEGKCVFIVKGSKADPITASFSTSTDKLPILKLSKFYVSGETDEVKLMAFKSNHKDFSYEGDHGWFNGKYNVLMEHNITKDEYKSLLDLEKEWDNSPLKIKGYIIGNKYNSDMFEATFTPDISLNYKVVKYGDSWDDFKIQIVKDDSLNPGNPTPGWIGFDSISIYGDKIDTPINTTIPYNTEHTPVIAIPNNGYEYNKDYHFTFKIHNSIGIKTIEYTVKMEGGTITDPDMVIEAKHAFGDYVNMKVKGTEYEYSRPINSTNGLKEIKLTIQDTTDNNKVVYEKIQTVDDKGPAVYNFDINYDKNYLDKSLKHNTKYLLSIEYKNKIGERSKRVSKEFTTLQRDEIVIPNFELFTYINNGRDSEATSGQYVDNAGITLRLHTNKKITVQENPDMDECVKIYNIDKLVYYVKSDTGTVLFQHEIKDNVLRPVGPYNAASFPETYSSYGNGGYSFMYWKLYKDMQRQNKPYVPPLFELNRIYELGCIIYIEDKFKELSKFIITLPDDRGSIYSYPKDTYINSIQTRRERVKKLLITDPGIPSGTAVNITKAAELMKEYVGPYLKDKVRPIKLTMEIGNTFATDKDKGYNKDILSYHYCEIVTDLIIPANSKSVFYNLPKVPSDIPNPRDIFTRKPDDCISGVYDYEKMKPIFYILNENNNWFLCIKYTLFPKELERNRDFIYPFYNGWYYNDQARKTYLYRSFDFRIAYDYTSPDGRVLEFQGVSDTDSLAFRKPFGFKPGPIATIKGSSIKTVTTDLFLSNQLELSTISSAGYKIFARVPDKNYEGQEYDTPYLEQIPYDGCMLIIPVGSYDFLNIPEDPDDNLLVQANPNIGAHFKFFKISTDGTETPVENIEDAFSVGVRVGTDTRYDRFGKWTKHVNKRPVLEPGEKYKLKLWFIPFNNKFYSYEYYTEKVFVAYKQPIEPDPIPEPNEYNRILQPVGNINYPLGDFLSFDIIPKTMSQDISLRNRTTRIGREMLPVSMTDMVNAEFQDLGTIPSDEVIACLPSIYAHTFKSTKGATKAEYKRNHAKVKTITVTRKLNTMSGIYRPESMLGGKPADSFSQQKYFTTDDVSKYGFGVISPVTYTKSGIAEFNIREVFGPNYIRSKSAPYLNDDFYGYDVLSFNDGYKELGLTTIAFQCEPTTGYSNYNPSLSNRIKTLFNNNAQDSGDGFMYLYFRDTIANINRFLEVPEGAQKAHNLRTFRGVSIGETYTFKITFEDGKVDTYTKVIRDFTKDAVEAQKPILTNEHVAWDKIHNMPSTMPLNIKETFPYASNSEDKIYRALYIYKSSNFGKLDKYGTDCFSLMSAITRSIDTYNDNFLHINLFPAVYPRDVTVSAYYRSGPENSTWEATSPFKKPPVIDLKLFNNPDKDYLTGGGETDRAHRRSTFYNFAFNPYELERKTSTYYTETTTYDMIALVFNYAFYNVYNIIYYRVDRTTGEISYHPEDQNMVFKYEANPQAPLLSNKAMSYVHTVKPNGDIIKGGGEPLTVPTEIIGKIRYVVDEEYVDDYVVFYESYLFIEPTGDIIKYEVKGGQSPNNWMTLSPLSTDENNQGYTYGTGYWTIYDLHGSVQIQDERYSPNMKLRLTKGDGQVTILNVKLGNLKRTFPGGKEYEAIITPGTE